MTQTPSDSCRLIDLTPFLRTNIMERDNEELVYTHQSLLDTDLYKVNVHLYYSARRARRLNARARTQFTMQQAIRHHFAETRALYRFTHRNPDVLFPRKCIDLFHRSIQRMSYPILFVLDFVKVCQGSGICT